MNILIVIYLLLLCGSLSKAPTPNKILAKQTQELKRLQNIHRGMKQKLKTLTQQKAELTRRMRQQNGQSVAFSAYANTFTQRPGDRGNFSFGAMLVNEGGHYNNNTSTFTCPTTAVYWFGVNLFLGGFLSTGGIWASLMMNNQSIAQMQVSRNTTSLFGTMVCNYVLVQCTSGSSVYVQSTFANSRIWGIIVQQYSIFIGFRLS